MDLSTRYMGLHLRNPLIVSSCGLTNSLEGVRRCADAGAGAVVLKSLFEEQIGAEIKDLQRHIWPSWHPEAFDYVERMSLELGPNEYLKLIEDAKKAVSIPVIASLNCISSRQWVDYAKRIESAGADALELNVAIMPSDPNCSGREIEEIYFRILEEVKARLDIPIAVKIGPYFSSMAWMAKELCSHGASALVLFNRFYQVDIDVDRMEVTAGVRFSSPDEISLPLRWVALLSDVVRCDLAASTGVHDGTGAIKLLLAGADAVQICSTLYINGLERIGLILRGMEEWMREHRFKSIGEFKGKLSRLWADQPEMYERLQYIKALTGIE